MSREQREQGEQGEQRERAGRAERAEQRREREQREQRGEKECTQTLQLWFCDSERASQRGCSLHGSLSEAGCRQGWGGSRACGLPRSGMVLGSFTTGLLCVMVLVRVFLKNGTN